MIVAKECLSRSLVSRKFSWANLKKSRTGVAWKKSLIAGISSLSLLSACQKSTEVGPAPQGGVDGSGGLVTYLDETSFSEWVSYDHTFYLRDLLFRLEKIKERSPEYYNEFPDDLANRFIGETPGEIQNLGKKNGVLHGSGILSFG